MTYYGKKVEVTEVEASVVINAVEKVTCVSIKEIHERNKHAQVVHARQLLCYFLHKIYGLKCKECSNIVGRYYTTILTNAKTIQGLIDIGDHVVCKDVSEIKKILGLS